MQVDVINIEGKKTGRTVELPEEIFGVEPNKHVVYLAVKQYLASQRQGTHKVKTRAEVKVQAANCTARKVPVEAVKEISATLFTKVVVLCSVLNPMPTISNSIAK
jgi:ribosomal protein L4